MSKFLIKLNNCYDERTFLKKLDLNFKTINSKNILIDRDFNIMFETDENMYVFFEVTPTILNFPLYVAGLMAVLWTGIKLVFDKNTYFLLIAGGIFLILSLFWSKYFYYFMLKQSLKKHNINDVELI